MKSTPLLRSDRRQGRTGVLVAVVVALVTGACGGGGGGGERQGDAARDDPLEQVAPAGERPVQVTGAGKVRLAGTLLVPPEAVQTANSKAPGVLVLPPIGPGNRNGLVPVGQNILDPLGQDLAKVFGDAGMVSYRYDRRGTGESKLEGDARITFEDLVADARAGLDLLAQRKETAGSELSVVGYDEGGLVALRLAANDPRVKRVVLVSTPGRPVVEVQAAELTALFGPESGEALRAAVSRLLATRSVPPLGELRTELRPLLPAGEAQLLADLYAMDPVNEASRVKARALVVVPAADGDRFDPAALSRALSGAEVVTAPNAGPTLSIVGPPPTDDPADPASPRHEHGAGPAQAAINRDAATVGRIAAWLSGGSTTG